MTTSPSKSALKSSHLADPSIIPLPASPQKPRTVRRLQSYNQLSSSNSPSLITQQRQQQHQQQSQRNASTSLAKKESKDNISSNAQSQSVSIPTRTRAHSDAPIAMKKGSSNRRPYGLSHGRKSSLEVMLREGPVNDNLEACVNDLRYKILTSKVDAYPDGMVFDPLPVSTHLIRLF